ncbi:MAG: threonine--tRNA ligase [Spirochaetaceae bacterium]|nr:MAG: threonine--tRNA ligase [Spirochaetaceae bacterium]
MSTQQERIDAAEEQMAEAQAVALEQLPVDERLYRIRHSAAHVMAEAVLRIFPDAKVAIGPPIENGFYYDFDLPRHLTPEDLEQIEEHMREIVSGDHRFTRTVLSREAASEMFCGQPYKLELIRELPDGQEISIYTQNSFTDLCRGPHVDSTRRIHPKAFKLLSVAGAYWRGDEKRPMLQRIYGTAWETPKELRAHLEHLKEVEKRDHRRVGRELDLFSTHEEAGPGLIYWHPKGSRIRIAIEDYWRAAHREGGYEMLFTPHVGKAWLWQTSGHLDFYKENMYAPMELDNADYYAKPMNCPFHIMIYKTRMRSYRDLPLRWGELGTVYRYERSGVLHGLLRVRGFTQDDAHIFCTPAQIEDEIKEVLRFSLKIWDDFGFSNTKAYLATRPPKSVGDEDRWYQAQRSLQAAIEDQGLDYELDEGGGAFYGPKIDLKIRDALGREWQMTTIQFDFNLPDRFDMSFTDSDGREKRPYMVHRALLGSLERFFGVLIEHYGGAFPLWLAPVQAVVIPVASAFDGYAAEVADLLFRAGFRAEADLSDDRMNAKIRNAQNTKTPCMVIVGEQEQQARTVSLRTRTGERTSNIALEDFMRRMHDKVVTRAEI